MNTRFTAFIAALFMATSTLAAPAPCGGIGEGCRSVQVEERQCGAFGLGCKRVEVEKRCGAFGEEGC
jgi:hypothetical protein